MNYLFHQTLYYLLYVHHIHSIEFNSVDNSYNIFIKKQDEVMPWKKFNSNMAISVEYDLEY